MQNVDGVKLYSVEEIGHLLMHVFNLDEREILTNLQKTEELHRKLKDMQKKLSKNYIEPCWDCRLLLPMLREYIKEVSNGN